MITKNLLYRFKLPYMTLEKGKGLKRLKKNWISGLKLTDIIPDVFLFSQLDINAS